jgi:4-hydroxy-3-methylbut-2-en-1-yl diphosphate reductase
VDMESAWLAQAAGGRPFIVLRVVLDAPGPSCSRSAALGSPLTAWRALRRAAPALAVWARLHETGAGRTSSPSRSAAQGE